MTKFVIVKQDSALLSNGHGGVRFDLVPRMGYEAAAIARACAKDTATVVYDRGAVRVVEADEPPEPQWGEAVYSVDALGVVGGMVAAYWDTGIPGPCEPSDE